MEGWEWDGARTPETMLSRTQDREWPGTWRSVGALGMGAGAAVAVASNSAVATVESLENSMLSM